MIRLDMLQGSPEWLQARIGIPTASQFHRILTPKTMKPSASATGYIHELIAEWILGTPLDDYTSQFMERGTELEDEAVSWYEMREDITTDLVGFCLRDDRLAGCSPDRLVGENGGLEIKNPSAKVHVGYLLGSMDEDHRCQVQGALLVTGREWWDLVSYNPVMPRVCVRCYRDEKFIAALDAALDAFTAQLAEAKEKMIALGCTPAEAPKKVSWSDVSQEVTP
ncbi:MAG TPA: exonuclease [Geobacter sp.]|nr:exonuclease [Geobacter sp.]